MFVFAIFALAALQAAPPSFVATPEAAQGVRLHVGETGIRCLRLPCPARAVFEPGESGRAMRERMAYVDLDGRSPPPPMIGAATDLAALRDVWEERQCLVVIGRLIPGEQDQPVLRVDQVLGPCGAEQAG